MSNIGIIGIHTTSSYETRAEAFEAYKDTLPKEPSGDVKKEYWVGCFQKSDWEFIHEELMKDGSLEDNIPTDKCDCINDCLSSDVRGVYLLTETEASELRANPKVDYVNIRASSYPGTYKQDPEELIENYRYASNAKHQQQILKYSDTGFNNSGSLVENPAPSSLLNRCSSQLHRHGVKKNPWVTLGDPKDIINSRISQYGTGTDVDIIVCDTACWIAHIEFMNPNRITSIKSCTSGGLVDADSATVPPSNYVGGNALKIGFTPSATNGACDVLDLVLDAPYYLDPDFFEANSGSLMTRWDGTTVPTETAAKNWWGQNSTTYRSAKYVSSGSGGSATGDNDFGTVPIPTSYTRANCNGSNTTLPPNDYWTGLPEQHGTNCASQAYGRTYGWAYNANKWYLDLIGQNGMGLNDADGFDVQKIFHQIKPNRASDNTKNPTISSNSWGRRFSAGDLGSSGYYFYRPATTDGTTTGVQYTSWTVNGNTDGTGGTAPRFMTNRAGGGQQIQCEPLSGVPVTAATELITAGVIFVCAAGNHNQKMVKSTHADYNNYVGSNDDSSLSSTQFFYATDQITYHKTLNRSGYPGAFNNTINIGALDGEFSSGGKERKVFYSSTGDYVDCYAVAGNSPDADEDEPDAMSLAASAYPNLGFIAAYDLTPYSRYDSFYTYDSSQSLRCGDFTFNGTSSACPIAVGLIATKLQYNRTWTSSDIKSWLTSTVGQQDSADFYYGTESTTANDTTWSDLNSIQGGAGIVPYDTPVSEPTGFIIKDKTMTGTAPSTSNNGTAYVPLQFYLNSDIVNKYAADIGTSAADSDITEYFPSYSSKYTGKHVDIVTAEGGMGITATNKYPGVENTHPEFDDPDNTGTTRCIPMDWPGLSEDTNNQITNSSDGMFTAHALGTISVAGGVNCGYAKKASLRTVYTVEGYVTVINSVVSWHNSKSNNPITGIKDPTILIGEFQFLTDIKYAFKVDDIQSVTDPTGGTTNRPASGWGSDLTPFTSRNIIPYKLEDPDDDSWHWVIPIPNQSQYSALKTAMDAAWDAGIVLIMSVGNNGGTYVKDSDSRWSGTYISFTGSYTQYNISWSGLTITKTTTDETNWYPFRTEGPQGHDKSIDVAAAQNSQAFPCMDMYSTRGPGIDVVGMGDNTWSAYPVSTYGDGNQWGMFGGTSCAAPTVAGKAACMMEEYYTLYGSWPTPNQVKSMVIAEAKSVVIDVVTTTWDNVPTASDTNINVTNSTTGTALVEIKDGISANGALKFAELAGTPSKRGFWNAKGYNRSQTLGKRTSTSTNGVKYPRPYNLGQAGSLS